MPSSKTSKQTEQSELETLRQRLQEAEEIIHAIRLGEVDAVVARGPQGDQVYTLQGHEHPYQSFLDGMREGALTLGLDGTILFANPMISRMMECGFEELIGTPFLNYVAPKHKGEFERALAQAQAKTAGAEVQLVSSTKKPLEVKLALYPLKLDQAQAISMLVTDLTEQRRLADTNAKMASERDARIRIGTILEGITDCYLLLDEGLSLLDVNRRALELLFNSTREAVMGRSLHNIHGGLEYRQLVATLTGALQREEPTHCELQTGGNRRWFEVHAYPSGGRLLVYMRDIDDRRRAEAELRLLNETLEQRIELRMGEAQHRSRQLQALTRQLINAEQRERRKIATDLHDYLAQILVVCKLKFAKLDHYLDDVRGAQIFSDVNGFMDQALTYTRTLIAELSPTALQRAGLHAGLEVLAEKMKQLGLTVELTAEGDFRELAENEAILLYQAIRELLLNVIKHAGVELANVHSVWQPERLTVRIKDAGRGFDPVQMSVAPSAEGKFGLLNVRERIEAIGGVFEVKSTPGEGTQVELHLPLGVLEIGNPALQQQPPAPANGGAEAQPEVISVLLVDDHRMVREGLRSVIDATPDLNVIGEASNGEDAVQLEAQLRPRVVVMDVNMPRLNGIEATRRIRARSADTVIIGLSIFDEDDVTQVMKQAGAAALMGKSRAGDELCDLIRRHVNKVQEISAN